MTPTPVNSAVSVGWIQRDRHERHRGEVVDLVRVGGAQRVDERAVVEQVALVERDPVAQVLDALELLGRGAADHAVDLVALLQQQLGQVGPVLAGDSRDQRSLHEARQDDKLVRWHLRSPTSPASATPTTTLPTGVRVHVAETGPEDAPPVLCLHGWPQHWLIWRER